MDRRDKLEIVAYILILLFIFGVLLLGIPAEIKALESIECYYQNEHRDTCYCQQPIDDGGFRTVGWGMVSRYKNEDYCSTGGNVEFKITE